MINFLIDLLVPLAIAVYLLRRLIIAFQCGKIFRLGLRGVPNAWISRSEDPTNFYAAATFYVLAILLACFGVWFAFYLHSL